MRAIVLSGGGAKGSYELGVWKALKELGITYDIVTGASVGALNGAFMVQDDYKKALNMWENINFDMIFNIPFPKDISDWSGLKEMLKIYGKGVLKGGLQVEKLEKTVKRYIDCDAFYRSIIDYGLTTIELSTLTPIMLRKKEIPQEQLADYLVASATCFPFFQLKKIKEKYYIDGGYYDNLPIDLAISLGATEVIAVDIGKGSGIPKDKYGSVPITYITPKNHLGSFLVFDAKLAKRNITLGYYDTMKIYQRYEGDNYTFYKGTLARIAKQLKQHVKKISKEKAIKKVIYLKNNVYFTELVLEMLEYLAKLFMFDVTILYSASRYQKELKKKYKKIQAPKFQGISVFNDQKGGLDKVILFKSSYQWWRRTGKNISSFPVFLSKVEILSFLYFDFLALS